MNDLDPLDAPKVRKPELKVKKLGRNDIKWSNHCGNQTTHFANYTKSLNV